MANTRKTHRITQVTETSKTNAEEVTNTEKVKQIYLSKEPDYVKLYLEDVSRMNEIPKWCSGLLYEFLKRMNYENEVLLPSQVKKRIAEEVGLTMAMVDNALSRLTKKRVFTRLGTGVYLADPYLFGRGDWNNIRKIRTTYTYEKHNQRTMQTAIEFGEASKQKAS